jgi:anaerobic magnesium-protoporphyrin IX monomethyl ester cyclase
MSKKILLVVPPRLFWPYVSGDDNFLVPQNMVCLAATLLRAGFDVEILDCLPLRIGWRSLARILLEKKPDIVAMGENHALYENEIVKGFKLVKEILPAAVTIAGGAHFTNVYKEYIFDKGIDIIIAGEGDLTIVELVEELHKKEPNLSRVKGLIYCLDGKIVRTPARELIKDLDTLPLPAYHLVPMHLYGRGRYLFSPGGATIHHSRGCTNGCEYCVWWTQDARRENDENGGYKLKPCWRTKSVERTFEEIELIHKKYKKKWLLFVDGSWNIDPDFNERFADEMLRREYKIDWFSFMRADCILRDEKRGIMEKLVRSGRCHTLIGIERVEKEWLKEMKKGNYLGNQSIEAFKILQTKYPQVFTQGTFIVGVRDETRETMWQQAKMAKELELDFPSFHPLTPVPGTKQYEEAKNANLLETFNWQDYNWATPVMSSKYLSRAEIELEVFKINKYSISVKKVIKSLFARSKYKRNMYRWWLIVSIRLGLSALAAFINPFKKNVYSVLVKPKWYDK